LTSDRDVEILCVPLIEAADVSLRSLFEQLADGREDFAELASHDSFGQHTVIELPQRDYRPRSSGS
jgi:hypothetical protein